MVDVYAALLEIFLFATLLMLSVYDAREYRIPNKGILLLIVLSLLVKWLLIPHEQFMLSVIKDTMAGGVFFAFGFILYLIKGMAPGDVKLLGGVGFLIGWQDMLVASFYLAVAMVMMGLFYFFFFHAQIVHKPLLNEAKAHFHRNTFSSLSVFVLLNHYVGLDNNNNGERARAGRMPFAPVLVVGLMLYQYYSG